jgi:hypothetical protein
MSPPATDDATPRLTIRDRDAESTSAPIEEKAQAPGRKGLPKRVRTALRWAIGAVVLAAVGRQIIRTWENWQAKGDLFQVSMGPMAAAGALYVFGLIAFGLYYAVIVRNVSPATSVLASVRAYLLSHPAKYVPGKAMVVVVRVGVLGRAGASGTVATLTAIYETLSMMAMGGLLGGVLLLMPRRHPAGAGLSFALGAAFLVTVLPWTFGKAVRLLKKGLPRIDPAECPRVTASEAAKLIGLGTLGWAAWGLSAVLVASSLNGGRLWPVSDWPRIAGAVMAGTVGGFALPILPGGLGLREGIYHEMTKGVLGPDLAIASALALRFVWVVGELAAALAISVIPERKSAGALSSELPEA